MSTATTIARRAEPSPRIRARVAGAFYLLNIVAGSMALVLGGRGAVSGQVTNLIATAFYVVVTLLFYGLFRPVNKRLSLLAADGRREAGERGAERERGRDASSGRMEEEALTVGRRRAGQALSRLRPSPGTAFLR